MLDPSLDPLIGRDAVLAEVAAKVARHRLVTLTGPGGTGKTRLAQAVVEAARSEREAFFVDLSTLTEGERLGSALAVSLGITEEGDADAAVRAWARSGTRLLALDNLEQVRDVAAPVGRLLDDAPGLSLLATSRGPVGVRGEHEIRIQPLAPPSAETPEAVEASAAGSLFLERARALGRLDPPLDAPTARDIAALCRRLDGLPLALELAAARTRILSPSAILAKLDERNTGILRRAEGEARHRSLDAVLDWSLGLLNPEERSVLEGCAVCAGTFGLDLLEAIVPDVDALTTVESLVAHGLVVVDEEVDREPRFRLLETVRLGVLATLGEREDELRRRHAEGVAQIVRRWGPEMDGADIRRAIAKLDADLPNLQLALGWTAKWEPSTGAEMLLLASRFLLNRGLMSLVDAAIQLFGPTSALEPSVRLPILTVQSSYLTETGREAEAMAAAREGVKLAREAGDRDLEAELLYNLLFVGIESGLRDDAELAALTADIEGLALTGPRGTLIADHARAIRASRLDGVDAASRLLEASLRAAPDGAYALGVSGNLSFFALAAGRLETAVEAGSRGVRLAVDFGDPDQEEFAGQNLATALAELGKLDEARAAMTRALAISASLKTPLSVMDALRACGSIAAIYGRPRDAAWLLGAAQAAYAPTPLADPEDDESSGAGRHWRAARKAIDPVAWEIARREGAEADREAAFDRALDVLQRSAGAAGSAATTVARDRLRHADLTRREIEILTLVGEGRSDVEIGERLFISRKTASVHVANVKAKLGAASRLEVALRAREMGLVGSSNEA